MSDRVRVILSLLLGLVAIALFFLGYLTQPVEAIIRWSTESEVDTAGFHVYRATEIDGEYERVSTELQPSSGDPFSGASYTYTDDTIEPGQTYYYQQEEFETTGTVTRLVDTVAFESPAGVMRILAMMNWTVVSGLLVALAGIWLLPGPRRPRNVNHEGESVGVRAS